MGQARAKAVVGAAAAILALAAWGCGGEDGPTEKTTEGSGPEAVEPQTEERSQGSDGGKGRTQEKGSQESAGAEEAAEQDEATPPPTARRAAQEDSGGGAKQFRAPGGDNSIQTFGEEAPDSEREQAAVVLHAFLEARARERWDAVCSYLSLTVIEQLEQLSSRVRGAKGTGCAETLAAISPPVSGRAERELIEADVGSLRTEGERAFILYRGAGGESFTMTMAEEGGEWKVASLAPIPLS